MGTRSCAAAAVLPVIDALTLHLLASFPQQLAATFATFAPADWRWAPSSWDGVPSEPLTALAQVCHVRDVEVDGYQLRIRRTLSEAHPQLAALPERDHSHGDPMVALAQFTAARARTLAMLATLTSAQLVRSAHFEGYGDTTLLGLVHYLCSHDQQHLAGLQWLKGKRAAAALP